jgi:hypothetical protein
VNRVFPVFEPEAANPKPPACPHGAAFFRRRRGGGTRSASWSKNTNGESFSTPAAAREPFLVAIEHVVLSRAKPAGREAIDRDPVRTEFVGQAHRQLLHAAAAGRVGSEARVAEHARHAADIDDPARAAVHDPQKERRGFRELHGVEGLPVPIERRRKSSGATMAKRGFLRESGGQDAQSERPASWHGQARPHRRDPQKSLMNRKG